MKNMKDENTKEDLKTEYEEWESWYWKWVTGIANWVRWFWENEEEHKTKKYKKTRQLSCSRCWINYFLWLMGSELIPLPGDPCTRTRHARVGFFFFSTLTSNKKPTPEQIEGTQRSRRSSGGGFSYEISSSSVGLITRAARMLILEHEW